MNSIEKSRWLVGASMIILVGALVYMGSSLIVPESTAPVTVPKPHVVSVPARQAPTARPIVRIDTQRSEASEVAINVIDGAGNPVMGAQVGICDGRATYDAGQLVEWLLEDLPQGAGRLPLGVLGGKCCVVEATGYAPQMFEVDPKLPGAIVTVVLFETASLHVQVICLDGTAPAGRVWLSRQPIDEKVLMGLGSTKVRTASAVQVADIQSDGAAKFDDLAAAAYYMLPDVRGYAAVAKISDYHVTLNPGQRETAQVSVEPVYGIAVEVDESAGAIQAQWRSWGGNNTIGYSEASLNRERDLLAASFPAASVMVFSPGSQKAGAGYPDSIGVRYTYYAGGGWEDHSLQAVRVSSVTPLVVRPKPLQSVSYIALQIEGSNVASMDLRLLAKGKSSGRRWTSVLDPLRPVQLPPGTYVIKTLDALANDALLLPRTISVKNGESVQFSLEVPEGVGSIDVRVCGAGGASIRQCRVMIECQDGARQGFTCKEGKITAIVKEDSVYKIVVKAPGYKAIEVSDSGKSLRSLKEKVITMEGV
jgi:hypothetical protein